MKTNLLSLLLSAAFLLVSAVSFSQDSASAGCQKTCEVTKDVGEGVFLGVRIQKCGCEEQSIKVVSVIEGTQAEAMGIKANDKIVSINNTKMYDVEQMQAYVKSKYKGYKVDVELIRGTETMVIPGEFGYEKVHQVTERICCDENVGLLELSNFKLYPNPTNGIFNVNFEPKSDSPLTMRIVNVNGQVIYEKSYDSAVALVREQIDITRHRGSAEHLIIIEQDGKVFKDKVVMVN